MVGLVDPAYLIDPAAPARNRTATPAFAPGFRSSSAWEGDGDQRAVGGVVGVECSVLTPCRCLYPKQCL